MRALVREHQLRFTEGNAVALFREGGAALQAMIAAIEGARSRIHLETYILRSDATGRRFLDLLTTRARSGCSVRLLYDAVGSRGLDASVLHPLRQAGGEIVAFNPLGRIYPHWAPRRRDHRKILAVDGQLAFAGGLNIGDEYWGAENALWRDTHVRIEGPAVRDLDAVFLESWFRADGSDLSWRELVEHEPAPVGDVRCAVVPDGPVYRRRRMRDLVAAGLGTATGRVQLASPYFAPGRRVLAALAKAGRRGVSVDLVLAGPSDHPLLRRAAHSLLPRLLASGVRVYEYQDSMMHAKVGLFDDRWVTVGSSNLDRQSFEHSYEVNLVLESDWVAAQIAERFERDLQHSRRIWPETLASRSFFDRWLDRLAAMLLRFL